MTTVQVPPTDARGAATHARPVVPAQADVVGAGRPKTPSAKGVSRVEKFLATMRDVAAKTRYADVLNTASVERAGVHVHVTATVPAQTVIAVLSTP